MATKMCILSVLSQPPVWIVIASTPATHKSTESTGANAYTDGQNQADITMRKYGGIVELLARVEILRLLPPCGGVAASSGRIEWMS